MDVLAGMNRIARRLGAIALVALFMRAILPDGWMLAQAQGAEGRYLTVELCEGHDQKPTVIDLDTGKEVDPSVLPGKTDDKRDAGSPCVFSAAAPMAPPAAEPVAVVFVLRHEDIAFNFARDLRPGRGIPAPPPPSTGPPSLT
jgi:hypothetical protein